MTATPEWNDGRHVRELWGESIYTYTLSDALIDGYATPVYFMGYESCLPKNYVISLQNGDYNK